MAKTNGSSTKTASTIEHDFAEVAPIAGYDLSAKHAKWEPEDGVALKGVLIGIVELPSAQANQVSWTCYAIRLTGPTLVRDPKDNVQRRAEAGELVVTTATASLQRLRNAALDPVRAYEIYLKYSGKEKTKSGGMVKVFESMIVGKSFIRTDETRLPSAPTAPALPPSSSDEATPF